MPHESTVNPEEPMHFQSWGDGTSQLDALDRRKPAFDSTSVGIGSCFTHSLSVPMQTHPDLPLYVTHDHDDDGDPDDEGGSNNDQDLEFDFRSKITYTPPKRNSDTINQ